MSYEIRPIMKNLIPLILIMVLSACSNKPHAIKHTDITVSSPTKISIVSHGWHTGFVIPAKTIQHQLPKLKQRFKDVRYIEFGWGDTGFYQAKEITSGLTMRAILWPTETVVHAVAVPEDAKSSFPNSDIRNLCLNQKQYALLLNFIVNSFSKNSDGDIIKLKRGIYGDSQFYQGEGDYYLMNTCNKWTAKGLKSAGFDISPTFKLTASSIIDYLDSVDNNLTSRLCDADKKNKPDPKF